ncbi:hypothetical protein ACFQX6_56070 [Streptosporangium lutulentum]
MRRRLTVMIAVLALLCVGMTGAGASAEPQPNGQYKVQGPSDARQRSAVAATGAAIDQVDSASIVVTATEAEVAEIKDSATPSQRSPSPCIRWNPRNARTSRQPTPATTTTPS